MLNYDHIERDESDLTSYWAASHTFTYQTAALINGGGEQLDNRAQELGNATVDEWVALLDSMDLPSNCTITKSVSALRATGLRPDYSILKLAVYRRNSRKDA